MQFPDSFFEDEVRNGFFVPALMKRAWAAELEVLKDIAEVCKKHQIRWFADFGTLLGAVRHSGFIPWDDDIDICMFREDYFRFINIAKNELPEGYYIPLKQDLEDGSRLQTTIWNGRSLPFKKDRLKKYHGFPFLAAVDIYPLDYTAPTPEDEEFRKNIMRIIFYTAVSTNGETATTEEIKSLIARVENLLNVSPNENIPLKDHLFSLIENLSLLYLADKSAEVMHPSWFLYDAPNRFPADCFNSTVMLPFEGTEIPVPAGYDQILRIMFGDYMKCCRTGSSHSYPFYKAMENKLMQTLGEDHLTYKYRFSIDDIKRTGNSNMLYTLVDDFLRLTGRIHEQIFRAVEMNALIDAMELLALSQNSAVRIGTTIEKIKGEGFVTVGILEEYCELTWQIYKELAETLPVSASDINVRLNKMLVCIEKSLQKDIKGRKTILFLPFKASLWDSLEPFWQEAQTAPDCDTYVIPIPYYYKNTDGSLCEPYYEGDQFPDYVPIVDYNSYDLKRHQPDMIFIHNPYDEYNLTTSVHPSFYARNLKQYTDNLVYVPYFMLEETESVDPKIIQNMEHFVTMPGVIHADQVIVQSERMRQAYIDFLTNTAGEDTKNIWEDKITCSSPIPFLKTR